MRRWPTVRLFRIFWSAVVFAFPLAAHAVPETAEAIEACVRDNLPRKSSVQTVQLQTTNRVGDSSESVATLHWMMFDDGLSKALLRFRRPMDMRGAGVLLIEKTDRTPDTFLYLPEVGQVRRVSSSAASNSLFGTDFSYEDFNRMLGMSVHASSTREGDSEIEGREAWVLSVRPAPEDESSYERIVMSVDKKTCVVLRTESWEPGDQLRKVLTADPKEIVEQDSLWVARRLKMRDERDETHTDIFVEEIEVNADIKQKMFSARELEAGAR